MIIPRSNAREYAKDGTRRKEGCGRIEIGSKFQRNADQLLGRMPFAGRQFAVLEQRNITGIA